MTATCRAYQASHPWITFAINLERASPQLWALLGQVVTLCEQVSEAVLPPAATQKLRTLYLVKGAQATTAIENNTLTEEQVGQALDGTLKLPPSQAYLGQEVRNILDSLRDIVDRIEGGSPPRLTPEWIADANRSVLAGLEEQLADGVAPGEFPAFPVGVGRYRAVPREDCGYLLDRLCRWLDEDDVPGPGGGPPEGRTGVGGNGTPAAAETAPAETAKTAPAETATDARGVFRDPRRYRLAQGVLKATLAHLYIAWIHPFGDGNGRTARLVEFMLLARAGVPFPSAQLLSNHFNRTRGQYYRELDRSSRVGAGRGDVFGFVEYAVSGFVDGLVEQCRYVEGVQMELAWEHFVFQRFRQERQTPATRRRRDVVLLLSQTEEPVKKRQVPSLSPQLASQYAGKTYKTLTRDLNWLVAADLIERGPDGYRARVERMRAFQASAQD